MSTPLRVGIIGCGLIGRKRAVALAGAKLIAVCDLDRDRADALARTAHGCTAFTQPDELLAQQPDIVIVATANNTLAPLALRSIRAGAQCLIKFKLTSFLFINFMIIHV